jgi:hypothetical protein
MDKNKKRIVTDAAYWRGFFYKNLVYFLFGLLAVIGLAYARGSFFIIIRIIAVLFTLRTLLYLLSNTEVIMNALFMPDYHKKSNEAFDKFMHYFSVFIFAGTLLWVSCYIPQMRNTIGGSMLFWATAPIGFVVALVLIFYLKKISPLLIRDGRRETAIVFGLCFGFSFLPGLIALYINYAYADSKVNCKTYVVVEMEGPSYRYRTNTYSIYINIEPDRADEFFVTKAFYEGVGILDPVQLCTQKGALGYDYLVEIK